MCKLSRIIRNSINDVKRANNNSTPSIFGIYYYGNYRINAGLLVIVYIFETDSDLSIALNNGLCSKIEEETEKALVKKGYPVNAFAPSKKSLSEYTFLDSLNRPKVSIRFISNQRVLEEADGILFNYLK